MKEEKKFDQWIGILSISVIAIVAIVFAAIVSNRSVLKGTYADGIGGPIGSMNNLVNNPPSSPTSSSKSSSTSNSNCDNVNAQCRATASSRCTYGYTGCTACSLGAYSCKSAPSSSSPSSASTCDEINAQCRSGSSA